MRQLSLDDFVECAFPDQPLTNRLNALFPGWEVVGYMHRYSWETKEDYTVMIWNRERYHLVTATICQDGRDYVGYVERDDFEPSWFNAKGNREWIWGSLEHRNRIFEVAEANRGRFERRYYYQVNRRAQ